MMTWYTIQNDSIIIDVWAKPNAKTTNFVAVDERGIHIALQAIPDQGKANKALIEFLAKQLGIKQKELSLTRGSKSRQKQICLAMNEAVLDKLKSIDANLK